MSVSGPPSTYGGPHPDLSRGVRPGEGFARERLRGLRDVFVPIGEPIPLHTAVVAVVLIVAALLLVLVPSIGASLRTSATATYLVLPAGAGLYMSMVALATLATRRALGARTLPAVFGTLALAWSLVVMTLVAFSDESWGLVPTGGPLLWLYPVTVSGIAFPLALLWARGTFRRSRWSFGLGTALLPPVLAASALLPGLSSDGAILLTGSTLMAAAALFGVSGYLFGRSEPSVRVPTGISGPTTVRTSPRRPVPVQIPATTRGPSAPVPARPPPISSGTVPRRYTPSPAPLSSGAWPNVVPTGFLWLDTLLMGGLPRRGQLGFVSEPGLGVERLFWSSAAEALRRGEVALVVTSSLSREEALAQAERECPGFSRFDREGRVGWIGAPSRGSSPSAGPALPPDRPAATRFVQSIFTASKWAQERSPAGFVVIFEEVSSLIDSLGEEAGVDTFRNAVEILRGRGARTLYGIDLGARSVSLTARLTRLLDGVLLFRSADGRPFLKVFRLSPVETRGWVECGFGEPKMSRRTSARGAEPAPENPRRP